jgi:hypothetical protein
MNDQRVDKLINGLKKLTQELEPGLQNHGPMRVNYIKPPPKKDGPWQVIIESGWDENYGGRLVIESSPKGKSLKVHVIPDEYGEPTIFRGDKKL